MAVPDQRPPEHESSRWVRRVAHDVAWFGWAWNQAPRPLRVVVWSVAMLLVGIVTAIGVRLGLPVSSVGELVEGIGQAGP